MRFEPTPLDEAQGAVLAHSVRLRDGVLLKGTTLGDVEMDRLRSEGIGQVEAVHLEADDLAEDQAAHQVALALCGPHLGVDAPMLGRANLTAQAAGLVLLDEARLTDANCVDDAITLSTLASGAPVRAGQLVATVKIIPFAVPAASVKAVTSVLADAPPLGLAPFQPLRVSLIITRAHHEPERRAQRAIDAVGERLLLLGSRLRRVDVVPHDRAAVARTIAAHLGEGVDLLLLFGASQTSHRNDVLPEALVRAGGRITRVGIPADPGNLLFHGSHGQATVLGVPGCARSPTRSGFDPVLERAMAGLELDARWFASLGAGGLYKESAARGQPRAQPAGGDAPRGIAGLLLAAGRSTRMGGANKLTRPLRGKPLVAWAADALLASRASPVVVVTGADAGDVERALAGRPLRFVHNPDFADGLSSSLRAGIDALSAERPAGVVVALGDMPQVQPAHVDRLIDAFSPAEGRTVCVPVHARRRGNPVLWGAHHFEALRTLRGDAGARSLLSELHADVVEVSFDDPGVLLDVDTPEMLLDLGGELG